MLLDQRSWNYEFIQGLFIEEYTKPILQLQIFIVDDDKLMWPFTTLGHFTPKLAYKSIINHQNELAQPPQNVHMSSAKQNGRLWLTLWNLNVHQRYKVILWRIKNGVLPTRFKIDNLVDVDNTFCPICNHNLKTNIDFLQNYEVTR